MILTAANELGGESTGSVNPKSATCNVYVVSSSEVIVLSVPAGASLTPLGAPRRASAQSSPASVDLPRAAQEGHRESLGRLTVDDQKLAKTTAFDLQADPVQRPARSSSPLAVRRVQGWQPIER